MSISILGAILLLAGLLLTLYSAIMFIYLTFSEGVLWGLGYLFIPFFLFVFVILKWKRAQRMFAFYVIGIGFTAIGMNIIPELMPRLVNSLSIMSG